MIGRDDLPVARSRAAAQPYQFFIPHKIKGRDEQPLARALMKISPVPTTAHAPVPHFKLVRRFHTPSNSRLAA
jgi:hypothetical protein